MSFAKLVDGHVVRIAGWRRMFRAVMISAVVLCAQSGDWAQVQALTPGAQVEVKRFSERGLAAATVESATEATIVVRRDDAVETYDRADVKRVRLVSDEKSQNGRITGMVVMGVLGGASAAISDGQTDGGGAGRFLTVPLSLGLGYLIGWAADGPKKIKLYKGTKP